MDAELNPTEMIEPGSGRRCVVQAKDVAAFEKRGYRAVVGGQPAPEADDLDGLTVAELKERASGLGLATGGRKAELIERIRAAAASAGDEDDGDDADEDAEED